MKSFRILSLILALITCIPLFACQNGGNTESEGYDADSTQLAPKESAKDTESGKDTESIKSSYYIVADSTDLSDARDNLKNMITSKYDVESSETGDRGIRLTANNATPGKISARLEGKELVIRAASAAEMKKAVICFWYENIAYAEDLTELPSDFAYEKDLADVVFYSDFNAVESDNECCMDALIAAHTHANANGLKIFADYGAKYYLASTEKTVPIKTDVEWGNAEFTIDDSEVPNEKRGNWIFDIVSSYDSYKIDTLTSVRRDDTGVNMTFSQKSLIILLDSNTKQYMRKGSNSDNGQVKRDLTVVNTDGSFDPEAPLMWDFDTITDVTVYPIDSTTITVSGGTFTTITNRATAGSNYYARGIRISRSNTNLKNVTHLVVGDENPCAPYSGFINVNCCAYINVENCVLTGRKTHNAGTYDIGGSNMVSVTFKNCTQTNDINDKDYWGIMGTNYCKNLVYDGCVLSRFDTHKGVTNATIKNSTIGHGGISVTGYGTLLLENTTCYAANLVNLRYDYGSTWEGDVIIRNCKLYTGQQLSTNYLIVVNNAQDHDFGYTCYMPRNVIIDGVYADTYVNTYVFHLKGVSVGAEAPYPYIPTESVTATDFSSLGEQELLVSPKNAFLSNVKFNEQ